jgi:signal transduction histidine kinase
MQTQENAKSAVAPELEQVERVFAERNLTASAQALGEARELAGEVRAAFRDRDEAARRAKLVFAMRLFEQRETDLAADPHALRGLVDGLHPPLQISSEALSHELLSFAAGSACGRPPAQELKVLLGLVVGLAPVNGVSLWRRDRAGGLQCVEDAGRGACSVTARGLARRLLSGEASRPGPRAELFGLAVGGEGRPAGALVARGEPSRRVAAQARLRPVLGALAAALDRDTLMARNAVDERALVEGGERRLKRLGFDLHDGPLQELLLLAEDLRLFREQLTGVLGEGGEQSILRGRLDDLDARLIALEGGLRRISTSLHASVLIDRPFAQALQDIVEAFTTRSSVAPELRLDGDADGISASQRIALLSVVGEALNNVREHGRTVTEVHVEIAFGATGVSARVTDDGCGFDVEAALLSAARRGRIGLAGIHERVRLLGGRCVVDSRPGGPTAVELSLPRWEPLAATPTRRSADRPAASEQSHTG